MPKCRRRVEELNPLLVDNPYVRYDTYVRSQERYQTQTVCAKRRRRKTGLNRFKDAFKTNISIDEILIENPFNIVMRTMRVHLLLFPGALLPQKYHSKLLYNKFEVR